MKIMATCDNCQRDLLLSRLVEGPGMSARCPWCGTLLARTTTSSIAEPRNRRAADPANPTLSPALAPSSPSGNRATHA
jgi:hypothetical protein